MNTAKNRRLRRITQVPNEPGYEWTTLRWLRRQVYDGTLPSYRANGVVLLDLNEVDAYVDAGRRERVA